MESAFQKALNNFVKDFGYGDAIMHLADNGYTLSQIKDRIGAHLPEEYLCEKILKSYLDQGRVLLAEPGSVRREKTSMVKDVGEFGQVSFRQVREIIEEPGVSFTPYQWTLEDWGEETLARHLKRLEDSQKNPEDKIYVSFFLTARRVSGWKELLTERQIDYLRCFCYLNQEIYVLLDERVWEILKTLLENHAYRGSIYLISEARKWIVN